MARKKKELSRPTAAIPLYERVRWQAAALALLLFIAYWNATASSFHFDDYAFLVDGYVTHSGFGWDLFRPQQTRPLTYLTFHWNYLAGGADPEGYHWVNLLLHAGNCILLLLIARRYFSALVAGCVALVFALHPLQTEAVTYVFARSTLLSTHFALWSIWFYVRDRGMLSAVMFGVSLLAKEETVALPAVLLLLDWYEGKRPRIAVYVLFAAFAAAAAGRLFYLIHSAPFDPGVGRVRGVPALSYLLTQGRVLWMYLRLFLLPAGLNLDRDVPLSTSLVTPWTTLAAWLAWLAAGGALAWYAWRKRPWAIWGLAYLVLIAPSSSLVPQADLMFEHRTYLPLVALVIALGYLLKRVPRTKLIWAFAVLAPLMVTDTILRNEDWHDEKSFWNDIARKSPGKARVYLGLARAYMADDPARTREFLRKGLAIDPNNVELQTNYGVALVGSRDTAAEALAHFQRALELSHPTADHYNNIGAAYYNLDDFTKSMESYRQALALDPCSYNARRNLVMLLANQKRPTEAYAAGEIPASCHLVPDQAAELERYRQQVGKRAP